MKIPCPTCRKTLALDDSWTGKRVKCPACQDSFLVPELQSEAYSATKSPQPIEPVEEIESAEESFGERRFPSRPRGRFNDDDAPLGPRRVRSTNLPLQDVRAVALYQKAILLVILADIVIVVAASILSQMDEFAIIRIVLAVCHLGLVVVGAVFVFLLSLKVYSTGLGIVMAILTFVPCLGLIILLIINGKATSTLRAHDIHVGFLGARMSDFAHGE